MSNKSNNPIDVNDPRLTDYVLGELDASEVVEIEQAIAKSPELTVAVEEIRQTTELLGAAYLAEEPIGLLPDQHAAIVAAGASDPTSTELAAKSRGRKIGTRPWLPIAIAATLLGLMVGGFMMMDFGGQESAVSSNAASKESGVPAKTSDDKMDMSFEEEAAAIDGDQLLNAVPDSTGEREKSLVRSRERKEAGFWSAMQDKRESVKPTESMSTAANGIASQRGAQAGQSFGGKENAIASDPFGEVDLDMDGRFAISDESQRQPEFGNGDDVALSGMGGMSGPVRFWVENNESEAAGGFGRGGLGGGGGGLAQNAPDFAAPMNNTEEAEMVDEFSAPAATEWQSRVQRREKFNNLNDAFGGEDLAKTPQVRLMPVQPAPTMVEPAPAGNRSSGDGEDASRVARSFSRPTTSENIEAEEASQGDMGLGAAGSIVSGGVPADRSGENGVSSMAGRDLQSSGAAESKNLELAQEQMEIRNQFAQLDELGVELETRLAEETRTRVVPKTQMRIENRTRTVERGGETVTEDYTVEVPYTENVTQNYTIQVPQQILKVDEKKAADFVDRLASRIDPKQREILQVDQLLELSIEQLQAHREYSKGDSVSGDFRAKAKASEGEEDAAAGKKVTDQPDADLILAYKLRATLNEVSEKDRSIADPLLQGLAKGLQKRNEEVRKNRSWKRVKAIPNTTRLMVGDKDELDMTGMQVNVQVDGFRARVLIDCFYYNDRARQLEGNFKLRLPDDASLYYFAFGESAYELDAKGKLAKEEFFEDDTQFVGLNAPEIKKAREDVWSKVKESRMVPREKAAHAYSETVRRKVDPALVEWSGAGVFNARVFPLAPNKLHRIVIGYDVNLAKEDGDWVYELDLPEQTGQCKVDLNVQPIEGVEYEIEPACDPFQAVSGKRTMKRYRFHGPQEGGIRLKANGVSEMLLKSNDETEGPFFGVQVTPELPVEKVAGNPRAIFLLDTSLSSNPDKFNVWLKMLEATLENNRDSLKQFNVAFFNVDTHLYKNKWLDNTSRNVDAVLKKCNRLALEGATDLYGAIDHVKNQKWVNGSGENSEQAGPDLFLLSDGAANWGETNMRLIGRQLEDGNFGNLFAYQSGLTGTAIANLRFLATESGGAVFTIATEDEIKSASTAHRKRPWKLVSMNAKGATDLMTAGRVKWVYPGQSITVVGRGVVKDKIELILKQDGKKKSVEFAPKQLESELASRLYGQVAVGQLESLGAKVFDVAASYARHFRVTGDTCSLLMLETEDDYKRFNIKPEEDLFVIKTKAAKKLVAETLKKSANELADPKSQLLAWMTRLETMPGMEFKMETAFKLALDEIQIEAISQPLNCKLTEKEGLSKDYLDHLGSDRLDYGIIDKEANRRAGSSVDEAIKVYSSLVERNPGNLEIARDVAFTAMELKRPAQAFHLLRNVAKARPFEGSIYPALGQCLTQLGQADQAIVYYEIALGGKFQRRGNHFKEIVATEYTHLLRKVVSDEMDSSIKEFAKARLETLSKEMRFKESDLVITMLWNTDQTDVDLHVIEPSGEECSYENTSTRSGGKITSDITTGFGPEMYFNAEAPTGKYDIQVKYFNNGQSKTELRNKVHLLIYRGYGTDRERLDRRTVELKTVGNKESVATIGLDK